MPSAQLSAESRSEALRLIDLSVAILADSDERLAGTYLDLARGVLKESTDAAPQCEAQAD